MKAAAPSIAACLLLSLVLSLLVGSPASLWADSSPPWAQGASQRAAAAARLEEQAQREGSVRLIVGLDTAFTVEGRLPPPARAAQRSAIARQQAAVAAALSGFNASERRRFRSLPFLVVEADAAAVRRLAQLPIVVSLREDELEQLLMKDSIPLIGADLAWADGFDGSGWAVAVLDSGVDTAHPFFATNGSVVAEACFSSNSGGAQSLCPDGATESIAAGAGANCDDEIQGCDHGTHVAGSVAGNDGLGPNFGVARGAGLIPIQVFSGFNSGIGSFVSDQVAALEHVLVLADTIPIAAVNMSLGGSIYSSVEDCDTVQTQTGRKPAIDNLRSFGIAVIAAAGNSGSRGGVTTPACISSAVSVGATGDDDVVAIFSNVAEFLDLLAPGVAIESSLPGGSTGSQSGTSMASPHVAGAWAVLKQKAPLADVDTVLAALRGTGTPIDDTRPSGTVTDMRRINVHPALQIVDSGSPVFGSEPPPDSVLDFGEVMIESAGSSRSVTVANSGVGTLNLSCAVSGEGASAFEVPACPAAVEPAANSGIEVKCRPASAGSKVATLTVTTNDAAAPAPAYSLLCEASTDTLFRDNFELITEPAE